MDKHTETLIRAVDTAVWAWNRKTDKRIDWKSAIQELVEAYGMYRLLVKEQSPTPTVPGDPE